MQMNNSPDFDPEGYIVDPDAWEESLALKLANEEGLKLNARILAGASHCSRCSSCHALSV